MNLRARALTLALCSSLLAPGCATALVWCHLGEAPGRSAGTDEVRAWRVDGGGRWVVETRHGEALTREAWGPDLTDPRLPSAGPVRGVMLGRTAALPAGAVEVIVQPLVRAERGAPTLVAVVDGGLTFVVPTERWVHEPRAPGVTAACVALTPLAVGVDLATLPAQALVALGWLVAVWSGAVPIS